MIESCSAAAQRCPALQPKTGGSSVALESETAGEAVTPSKPQPTFQQSLLAVSSTLYVFFEGEEQLPRKASAAHCV